VRDEGRVKGRRRAEAGGSAAERTARPAATKRNEPRISGSKQSFQRKAAKAQRRKEGKNSLRLCAFAPLRFKTACPSVLKSSRNCVILADCSTRESRPFAIHYHQFIIHGPRRYAFHAKTTEVNEGQD